MKLRNKKTGEIGTPRVDYQELYVDTENGYTYNYKSLQKMCEEWGDYEEPKGYWFISTTGEVHRFEGEDKTYTPGRKQLGNYFSSREEAEKAVKKPEAWKRLKDKGFRFNKWTIAEEPKTKHIKLVIEAEMDVPDSPYDLDLLFCPEVKNER